MRTSIEHRFGPGELVVGPEGAAGKPFGDTGASQGQDRFSCPVAVEIGKADVFFGMMVNAVVAILANSARVMGRLGRKVWSG